MFRNQYDNDVTTWSPQGRLLQVEYATEAVKQGSVSVGARNESHAVLVAIKRSPGELASYQKKILTVDRHVGIAIAGLTSDARVLYSFLRSEALDSRLTYDRPIPIGRLAASLADKIQGNTQGYGGRPYGVGLLIGGWDESTQTPRLFECSPTGHYDEYYGMAIGARSQPARSSLEKSLQSNLLLQTTREGLILAALTALNETLSGSTATLTPLNTSVAIVGKDCPFHLLPEDEIEKLLKLLPPPTQGQAQASEESSSGEFRDETGALIAPASSSTATASGVTPPMSSMDVDESVKEEQGGQEP